MEQVRISLACSRAGRVGVSKKCFVVLAELESFRLLKPLKRRSLVVAVIWVPLLAGGRWSLLDHSDLGPVSIYRHEVPGPSGCLVRVEEASSCGVVVLRVELFPLVELSGVGSGGDG